MTISVLREIDRVFGEGPVSGMTDAQLLERFFACQDEIAFQALVTRHGPMVLGVCRRVLKESHDAEDAFQATFLVMVRAARARQLTASLKSWLYRVAHRIAVRASTRPPGSGSMSRGSPGRGSPFLKGKSSPTSDLSSSKKSPGCPTSTARRSSSVTTRE